MDIAPRALSDLVSEPEIPQHETNRSPNESFTSEDATESEDVSPPLAFSNLRKVAVVIHLAGVNFTSSAVNGIVVIGLPSITSSLSLSPSLSYWPVSVINLATGSTLLLAGSVTDILGPRVVNLAGCFANGAFIIVAGLSRNGGEIVGIRAAQGVAFALHLASSISLITQAFPRGRGRNFAFSCLGLNQTLGYSFGLVTGGVLQDTVGWRAAWFLFGGLTLLLSTIGFLALPVNNNHHRTGHGILREFREKVDAVGAILTSAFLAMFSYLLAVLSTDIYNIKNTESIVLLCLSAVALLSFIAWVHRQVRIGRPALIPNSLWKNSSFSSICVTIALSYAFNNSSELFSSLFFQQVQLLSALQSSIRILPNLVSGAILSMSMGLFVDRISPLWIVAVSSAIAAGSPLIMALIQPQWSYWIGAFFAQVLLPVSTDALFTVGLIIISEVFPDDTQALAGAVFNTSTQIGSALGLAVMQVVSTLVTKKYEDAGKGGTQAVLQGLRAGFWTMFGFMVLCGVVGVVGLRKTAKVGTRAIKK